MNDKYLKYLEDKGEEATDLLEALTKLTERLKVEFGVSSDMENPDADRLHTPPCDWYTEVQYQTPDQLDSLTMYFEELANLAQDAAQAASMLGQVRRDIKDADPEDFED